MEEPIQDCFVSMDGTDFPINEPRLFSPKWYSFKFNGYALRYEIAVTVRSGKIVWVSGPWSASSYPYVRILRNGLWKKLAPFEFVIGDAGYTDTRCLQPPGQSHADHSTFA